MAYLGMSTSLPTGAPNWPSIPSRSSSTPPAKEWTFEYGARYHRDYGRWSPYLKLSAGRGTFDSIPDFYQGNRSLGYNMIVFGGGTDFAINNRLSVRAGAEYQDWFTGGLKGAEGVGGPGHDVYLPNGLTPFLVQVGVAYHFTGSEKIVQ